MRLRNNIDDTQDPDPIQVGDLQVPASSRKPSCDDLFLRLEWVPVDPDRIRFEFFVVRPPEQSVIAFELSLDALSQTDFERLRIFLERYQHQSLAAREVIENLLWLLNIAAPLDQAAQSQRALELLLCDIPAQVSTH